MTLTDSPASNRPADQTSERPANPDDREMTMMEHLQELRQRLVYSVLGVVVGIIAALIPIPGSNSLTHFVVSKLAEQAPAGKLTTLGPGEGFFTFLQVAMILGMALAMPVLIYQVLAFVMPALYSNERRYLILAVPGITISFLIGVLFCYTFMLPFAIQFLGGFQTDIFSPMWAAERYLDFVTTFLFWVGVTFELPIAMYFLTKLGIVSTERLVGFRKYGLVLAFVIGAIITPTPDPINQSIVSLPIYLLFELGIILSRFA